MKAPRYQFEIIAEHFPLLTVQQLLIILIVLANLPMSITTYLQHKWGYLLQLRS